MKNIIFILTALCAAVSLAGCGLAQDKVILTSDSGRNVTDMNLTLFSTLGLFGAEGLDTAEMVKFKAPNAGFKVEAILILGFDGYNGTDDTVPIEQMVLAEIRDVDMNLLYRTVDSQIPYFNFKRNTTGPTWGILEIPPVEVTDEFYVCFYDRGAISVLGETDSFTNSSQLFDRSNRKIYPAELPLPDNETMPVNWLIRVAGS
ncbi:MAG: hypothetical protein A4E45_02055 [Methanosaeta sp. PtaB.Bin039]|nr:MAG: hypothetical protein A4E45_02055 [Methanosaeta sp. PtaB.Bin039]HOT06574.1 hypothetical protein [Methanotrichaceae archaeon]HQF16544.1 hypothetical protein [Methanotrichaceae archaeon]HQI91085.1 hypothetical protein [Methanotrichaceae archaeon]HQJ28524.1 hypothetical protein [Methanotrichaceae archaeon]